MVVVGHGKQIGFRLRPPERAMLNNAARAAGMSPANWVLCLALVHLARSPQRNPAELDALRDLYRELRVFNNDVNQIAQVVNAGVSSGRYPPLQGNAVREAVELVRGAMRRIVAVITGNFGYWGLPDAERPTASPNAVKHAAMSAKAGEARRKNRVRKRSARFAEVP